MTGTETVTHAFDPNGNITGIGNKVLTYNHDNRLVRVEENSVTLGEYTYNGLGQRLIKTAGGTTTIFLYDFDGNIIAETDQTGSISKEYLYKGSSRLAMVDVLTGSMYYYGNDKLGTPQILTDATNTVVWEAGYKPFGEADVNPNSSVVNNFRFPGQYYDQETGLHYNYHRYYDPSTGRYLTTDPIGLAGGINLFAYSHANPINNIDPLGLIHGWEISGLDWVTLIKPLGYKYSMRYKFNLEYHRQAKICKEKYAHESCDWIDQRNVKLDYLTCMDDALVWKVLSEKYGYPNAMVDLWFWSEDENFERYKRLYNYRPYQK